MYRIIKSIIFFVFFFVFVNFVKAEEVNPPFVATCSDILTHAYRNGNDAMGGPTGGAWNSDEHFNDVWNFVYKGGSSIFINDQIAVVIKQHPGVLIVLETKEVGVTHGIASGIWSYAIHLGMKKVVASQVNASGHFDRPLQSVKARITNFDCTFSGR